MSAIDREKLLELIKLRKAKFVGSYKDIDHGAYMELETIEAYVESGAFDVREPIKPFQQKLVDLTIQENAKMYQKEDDDHE